MDPIDIYYNKTKPIILNKIEFFKNLCLSFKDFLKMYFLALNLHWATIRAYSLMV